MRKFLRFVFRLVFSRTLIVVLMLLLQIFVLFSSFTRLGQYFHFIWEAMTVMGFFLIIFIINRDEPTEFKLTWVIPICLVPVFGALIYLFVTLNLGGIGLKTRVARRMSETAGLLTENEEVAKSLVETESSFQGFAYYMYHSNGFPAYHNTEAVYYRSGEEKFPDLIEELKKAKQFIFLEYFIVERGFMWNSILEVLKEKVKEGVEVRVMYDGMNTMMFKLPYSYAKELRSYGIKAKMFAPIVPFLSTSQNNRDHRKIVVIDGKVAITGGINLADEYMNRKEVFGHWKDTSIKMTGDAVRSFTVMFLQMWNVSENGSEDYEKYLKGITIDSEIQKDGFVIPYGESPIDDQESAKTTYLSLINGASKFVHIMTPYFIVEREVMDSIRYAAQRGVEVSLVLPHIPDKKIVYYIARTFYPELLKAGIKVYEYEPGFVHAKVFSVDGNKATVGSVNLDYRSFYHHFECGAYFYHNSVIPEIEDDFQNTLTKCIEVTQDYYNKLPLYQKFIGHTFKFFGPLL